MQVGWNPLSCKCLQALCHCLSSQRTSIMPPQYLFPATNLIDILSMHVYPRCTPNHPGSRVHKALVEEISSSIAFIRPHHTCVKIYHTVPETDEKSKEIETRDFWNNIQWRFSHQRSAGYIMKAETTRSSTEQTDPEYRCLSNASRRFEHCAYGNGGSDQKIRNVSQSWRESAIATSLVMAALSYAGLHVTANQRFYREMSFFGTMKLWLR